MYFIGITGGVGAGKTQVLDYLKQKEGVRVMLADEIAHELMEPGTTCYENIKEAFAEYDIFEENGHFHKEKLAKLLFSNDFFRQRLNAIVHPAVKEYVKEQFALEKEKDRLRLLVLEAALLIEEHYDEICQELWYIHTEPDIRRARLKASRGYSDKKIDEIMESQLDPEVYRKYCKEVIDNGGSLEDTHKQIDHALGRIRL